MRTVTLAIAIAPLLGAGCSPRADEHAPALAPPVQSLPPGTNAKIGADQVGRVSPVPAFRAVGEDWRLQAEGTDGMRLSARLQRDRVGEWNATLVYDPQRANAVPRTHVLAGTLYGEGAPDRPVTVTLERGACVNHEGEHAWRATVAIEGEAVLAGCAEVATG
jgi:hypothetical protein